MVATAGAAVNNARSPFHLISETELPQNTGMQHRSSILGTVAVIGTLATAPAFAAPQILAVMSAPGPQQMRCAGELCQTDFSSYCLQRERSIPTTGQAYIPVASEQFTLVVTDANGAQSRLPAENAATFRSQRGYASVKVSLRVRDLKALGGVSVALEVAPGAALVPAPVAGDPNPISEAEMAFATRSLREHGNGIVDAQPAAQAATIVNRLATTIVPTLPADRPALDQLWHEVIDGLGRARPADADAIRRARQIYDWCQGRTSYHSMGGIKSCLEFKHDDEIMRLNSDYWNSQSSY